MVRAADGRVHVLYNRCPHKGAKVVADGEGCAGKFFRCPYHAWTFAGRQPPGRAAQAGPGRHVL